MRNNKSKANHVSSLARATLPALSRKLSRCLVADLIMLDNHIKKSTIHGK